MKEKTNKLEENLFVGKKIKSFRALNRLSQQDLAERLNMSVRAFQDIENDVTEVSVSKLNEIAEILGTNLFDLLGIGEGRFYFTYKGKQNNQNLVNLNQTGSEETPLLRQENTFLKEKVTILEKRIQDLEEMNTILRQVNQKTN